MAYKGMFWDNVGGSKDRHMRIQKHRDFIVGGVVGRMKKRG